MNIIKYRNIFFITSLVVLVPGFIALSIWGLRLGIDFIGGTLWEVRFIEKKEEPSREAFQHFLNENGFEVSSTSQTTEDAILVRSKVAQESKLNEVKSKVTKRYG